MEQDNICSTISHGEHMCVLRKKGCAELIQRLASAPRFSCTNCGAQANTPENLCRPQPLR